MNRFLAFLMSSASASSKDSKDVTTTDRDTILAAQFECIQTLIDQSAWYIERGINECRLKVSLSLKVDNAVVQALSLIVPKCIFPWYVPAHRDEPFVCGMTNN